jgi:hypothetical protein
MVHTTVVAIVLLLIGAVFTGAPPAQGGSPMTPGQNNRNGGGGNPGGLGRGVLSYRAFRNMQKKRHSNVLGNFRENDYTSDDEDVSYDSAKYPSYFNPAINVGPHPTSVPLDTLPSPFRSANDKAAISCQIDCQSAITLPNGQTRQIFSGCVNRYYSYGTLSSCRTPQNALPQDFLLAVELCGKSYCSSNILDQPDILTLASIASIEGDNAGVNGLVPTTKEETRDGKYQLKGVIGE